MAVEKERDMSQAFETVFVEQCATTMAGLKPSGLFSFRSVNGEAVQNTIIQMSYELKQFGLPFEY